MKLFLTIIFGVCVMTSAASVRGQEPSDPCPQPSHICDPRKFDEYGNLSFADEKFRLDNVAVGLKAEPDSVVYLYAYNGRRGCVGEAQARAARAKRYLVSERGIAPERVIRKDGGHREDLTIEVWVEPREAHEPYASPTVDPSEARLRDCKRRKRRGRGKP
jgi:hypothetical protein